MFVKKANYQPCLCFTFSLLVCRFKCGSFSLVSSENSFCLAFQAFKPSFSDVVIFVLCIDFAKRPGPTNYCRRLPGVVNLLPGINDITDILCFDSFQYAHGLHSKRQAHNDMC